MSTKSMLGRLSFVLVGALLGALLVVPTAAQFAALLHEVRVENLLTTTGEYLHIQTPQTTELTGLSGATATATDLIPAGCLVVGVTARVTTTITGATTWDMGDGTDVDAYGAAIILPSGTTVDLTDTTLASPLLYTALTSIVLTANGSSFTAGAVRVSVHCMSTVAPAS